jgi:hypothetical protein
MASAVGRDADQVAAADHDADGDAELARRHQVIDDVLDRRGVDAGLVRTGERLARYLHDDTAKSGHLVSP